MVSFSMKYFCVVLGLNFYRISMHVLIWGNKQIYYKK